MIFIGKNNKKFVVKPLFIEFKFKFNFFYNTGFYDRNWEDSHCYITVSSQLPALSSLSSKLKSIITSIPSPQSK